MTAYKWPTWADILGQQWECFENWGQGGAGNNFIFNSLIECDARNKFVSTDTILIMWSAVARIDYYQQNQWCHLVNRFSKDNKDLPFSCPDGYEILSYPLFVAADSFLQSKNVQYKFFSWLPYQTQSKTGRLYTSTLSKMNLIKFAMKKNSIKTWKYFNEVENLYERLHGPDWPSLEKILNNDYIVNTKEITNEVTDFVNLIESDPYYKLHSYEVDYHPLPNEHLSVIEQMMPNSTVNAETILWCQDTTQKILTGKFYEFNRKCAAERL